jgi:hypothetical protein
MDATLIAAMATAGTATLVALGALGSYIRGDQ